MGMGFGGGAMWGGGVGGGSAAAAPAGMGRRRRRRPQGGAPFAGIPPELQESVTKLDEDRARPRRARRRLHPARRTTIGS